MADDVVEAGMTTSATLSETATVGSTSVEAQSKLLSEYDSQKTDVKNRANLWHQHLEDYNQLKETLKTISDRVVHSSTMIPIGKKAYMEGTLVHTNEILVLLGDNWFAERSAKQAAEVCQRRIDKCTEMMEKLDQELTLIESWSQQASAAGVTPDSGEVDIREPYDEAAEAEWVDQHRQRLKELRQKQKEDVGVVDKDIIDDDDALFRRLDELEIEEELDQHIENEAIKSEKVEEQAKDQEENPEKEEKQEYPDSSSSEDWSESPPLSDEDVDSSDAEINAAIEAAVATADAAYAASVESRFRTVPDRNNFKRVSRFSVSEIISEREVLDPLPAFSSAQESARKEHIATLSSRPRRVSFGSISERLFLKDEEKTRPENPPPDESPDPDTPTIFFTHQDQQESGSKVAEMVVDRTDAKVPFGPSDFVRLYGSGSPSRLKSILKPSGSSHSLSSFEEESSSSSIGRFAISPTKSVPQPPPLEAVVGAGGGASRFTVSPTKIQHDPLPQHQPQQLPVKDAVIEAADQVTTASGSISEGSQPGPDVEEPRKPSRFKLSRVQLNP